MNQRSRQPAIIVEGHSRTGPAENDGNGAYAGDLPRLDRYLEIIAIIVGVETLIIALAVGHNWWRNGAWLEQILPGLNESGLAVFLAVMTIFSVGLFGALIFRNYRNLQNRTRQRNLADVALVQSEARLRLAQSAAGIATLDWDIAGDRAVWNANFFKVFGVKDISADTRSPYEHLIDLIHPNDRGRMNSMHLALLKNGGTYSDEFRILRPDGEIRWIAARGEVFCDARGIPRRLIGANFDITERRRTEMALRDSLNILEFANDAGEIGVWNNDFVANSSSCDERGRQILGFANDMAPLNADAFYARLHPADRDRVKARLTEAVKTGEKFTIECRVQTSESRLGWVRIRGMAELDPVSGRALRMTGIVFDITDRHEHERHLRFLVRELTHRSKNLLAVIQAMARQAGTTATSMEDFQQRFAARLHGLSASHDLLVDEDWHGAFMKDVVRSQIGPFADLVGGRITLNGPSLLLKPEAAQNIGMAIHELATNAAKYGALSNDAGSIEIYWQLLEAKPGLSRLHLTWCERNGPIVKLPAQRGFGSVVTERVVPRALEATVTTSYEPDGLTWMLDGPAATIITAHPSAAVG